MAASLQIERIRFSDYRNYEQLELCDLGALTVLVGPNAIGKTNILEGIQLLTATQSFRHPQIAQLIRQGASAARLSVDITDGNRRIEIALQLSDGKKRFLVNGKPKASVDVRGILPSVTFTPDDLELAKKSSSVKRAALDELGAQLNRNYYIVRRDYEKTLRYKNRLLKEDASDLLVDAIDDTLVTCGAQLYLFRRSLFDRLVPHVAENYRALVRESAGESDRTDESVGTGERKTANRERFSAHYLASWEKLALSALDAPANQESPIISTAGSASPPELARDQIRERLADELQRWRSEERRRRRALVGPHNDQIIFTLASRDASAFASQGQQRSIVLAWKLAEVALTREITGISPVLLLDDVLSELDATRREMLLGFVTGDVQTFVTATDLSGFSTAVASRARIVKVRQLASDIICLTKGHLSLSETDDV